MRLLVLLLLSPFASSLSVSLRVTGQPNLAVGFLRCPTTLSLASLSGQALSLSCNASSVALSLEGRGSLASLSAGQSWSWEARGQPETVWNTQVRMLDVMYDTEFDGNDALQGTFTVMADDTFLETKFGWIPGVSTFEDLRQANQELKRASGRCPMLAANHVRAHDFDHPKLVEASLKRYNWFLQYAQEKQGGVIQGTKDQIEKVDDARINYEALQEVVDAMYRDERMDIVTHENALDATMEQNELRRFQATCLAPVQPIFIKNGNRDMSFVRRGHYDDVAYTNQLNYTDPTQLVSAFEGTPKYSRLLFDKTLPHASGFPQPDINDVIRGRNKLEVTAYDIAAVTYEYLILWWSGKPITGDHADAFAGRWHRLQSVQGGSPNVNGTRLQSNYTEFKEALDEVRKHIIPHFESSPIWHTMWPQIKAGEFAASMPNLLAYMPLTAAISIGNIAANAEYILQRMRFDGGMRTQYRSNKRRFLLEWLRTRGGLRNTYSYTKRSPTFQTTYTDIHDGTERTAPLSVSNKYIESRDSVAANLDPSRFRAPNTFDMNRTDWMYTIWGLPLWKYYKDDGTGEENMQKGPDGEYTFEPDYEKWAVNNNGYAYGCPGVWIAQAVMQEVVDVFLATIEADEAATGKSMALPTCADYPLQVAERFGKVPKTAPSWSTECMWALARVDIQFGAGSGCERLGRSLCCATCASLDQTSFNYVHILRSLAIIDMKEKQFTWLTPNIFAYYLYTQKFFDDTSEATIPKVSGVTLTYHGAASILEYYTLQVKSFNPKSFRHYKRYYEIVDDEFESQPDRLRIKHWHMDKQENKGKETNDAMVAWPDFSHIAFANETAFLPFRNIFHDFRPLKGLFQFRPESWALSNSFGEKWEFCTMVQQRCTGNNTQWASVKECLEYVADMPPHKRGYCPLFAGNTLSCRWMHSILAQDGLRPEVHCFHMGPHRPDPDGKIKCHDKECGQERQGPWLCDANGCSGALTHAGTVVDWLHFGFWSFLTLWSLVVVVGGVRQLRKERRSPASLHALKKIEAVAVVFLPVAFLQALLYLIAAASRATLIWRPPPPISNEPRYLELRQADALFKDVMYAEPYVGQFSEPFFSQANTYIIMHMLYYLLVAGMCMTCIIIEWVGHRVYFGAHKNSVLYNEIPHVGSAVFVIFVSMALITPPSAFSLLLFMLGVTKLGYPEILMQCWKTWDISIRAPEVIEHEMKKNAVRKLQAHVSSETINHEETVLRVQIDEGKNREVAVTEQVCHYLAAVGLMLHHFMMCAFFAGSMSHVLVFEDFVAYRFSLNTILLLVLLQHLLNQLFRSASGVVVLAFIGIVELFFQWFVISNLGEAGTSLVAISVLSLAMSHWLMMPLAVAIVVPLGKSAIQRVRNYRKDVLD